MSDLRVGMFTSEGDLRDMECPFLPELRNNEPNKCGGFSCPMAREDYIVVNSKKIDYVYCGSGGKP